MVHLASPNAPNSQGWEAAAQFRSPTWVAGAHSACLDHAGPSAGSWAAGACHNTCTSPRCPLTLHKAVGRMGWAWGLAESEVVLALPCGWGETPQGPRAAGPRAPTWRKGDKSPWVTIVLAAAPLPPWAPEPRNEGT